MQLNVTHLLLHLTMINITKWTHQTDSTKNDQIYYYSQIQITPPSIVSPWENIQGHLRWAVCLSSVNTALCSQAVCLFRSSTLLPIHSDWKGQLSNPLRTPSLLSFPSLGDWWEGNERRDRQRMDTSCEALALVTKYQLPSRKRRVLRPFLILCVYVRVSVPSFIEVTYGSDEIPEPAATLPLAQIKLPTPAEPRGLTSHRHHDNGTPH